MLLTDLTVKKAKIAGGRLSPPTMEADIYLRGKKVVSVQDRGDGGPLRIMPDDLLAANEIKQFVKEHPDWKTQTIEPLEQFYNELVDHHMLKKVWDGKPTY